MAHTLTHTPPRSNARRQVKGGGGASLSVPESSVTLVGRERTSAM
jgi:hypothetical protein